MNVFEFLEMPFLLSAVHSVGLAILHAIWQGIVIAFFVHMGLILLRNSGANIRYLLAYVGLLLMLFLPICTLWIESAERESTAREALIEQGILGDNPERTLETSVSVGQPQPETSTQRPEYALRFFELISQWIAIAWSLGMVAFTLRLFLIWVSTQKLKISGSPKTVRGYRESVARLGQRLRLEKRVSLIETSSVDVPTVIGWLKPIILLPTSAVLNLNRSELEGILAHELAHVKRHDYLANFLQAIVETLLFFHPAAWWVSTHIRSERENACDDSAIAVVNSDSINYARALAKMERLRRSAPQVVLASNGGSLSIRIKRLLDAGTTGRTASRAVTGILMTVLALSAFTVIGVGVKFSPAPHQPRRIFDVPKIDEFAGQKDLQLWVALEICPREKGLDPSVIPVLISRLGDDEPVNEPLDCWNSGDWTPLLRTFKHSSHGEEAALALASMGDIALESLIAALNEPNASARRNAAWAIGELKGGTKVNRTGALKTLMVMLEFDGDPWVRRAAAFALSEIKDKRSKQVLINSLDDSEAGVKEMAIYALGEMKEPSALNALQKLLGDPDERVTKMARWAIAEIHEL